MPRPSTTADQSAAAYGAKNKERNVMKKSLRLFVCAVQYGAEVRASGRCLTADVMRRDQRYRDLIRAHGWSKVWGAAVQGWADENRRRSASSAPRGDQGGE